MANGCCILQNAFSATRDRAVICPKPRRLYLPADASDPRSANDLLDALFLKQSDPSPFFCGSPPIRSDNPMVHDARFGEVVPLGPVPIAAVGTGSGSGSVTSTARNPCARVRYGLTVAAVRIEGFDCMDIPAVA